jgi:hypothetical protein
MVENIPPLPRNKPGHASARWPFHNDCSFIRLSEKFLLKKSEQLLHKLK